jgi:uncharacterized protein (DUF302 family)
MLSAQTIGIDLPFKAWSGEDGITWLSYNDPAWLVRRHGGSSNVEKIVRNRDTLGTVATEAAE